MRIRPLMDYSCDFSVTLFILLAGTGGQEDAVVCSYTSVDVR